MLEHYITPNGEEQVDESNLGTVVKVTPLLPSLNHIGNRGLSNAYALLLGFMGIAMAGLAITILDQVFFANIWNFGVAAQENGTYLNIFAMMWKFLPIVIVFSFLIGIIVTSHKARNEAY